MFEDEIFFSVDPRVKIRNIGLRTNLGAVRRTLAIAGALLSFRRIVKEEQPDFVLSFMNKYNVFCLTSLFKTNIPTIASERGSPTEPRMEFRLKLRQLLYPYAKGIIAQTETGRRYVIEKIGHPNITVIYNPIEVPENPNSVTRDNIVLNTGRLIETKGQADLIRAFAKADVPDWILVICGDGPLRNNLDALAVELGIEKRINFMGKVKDVNGWYARAGVFAFPSYSEGFPNALAEALVAGVPTVSYDCLTGPSELINNGENGILVEVGDIEKLALHLRDLMTNPTLRETFSRNAVKTASKVDVAVIAKQYFRFCSACADLQVS